MTLSLTDSDLRDPAGDRAFERGADYARRGCVKLEESGARTLRAVVGSQRYRVETLLAHTSKPLLKW
jgi:uncharacterized Zn finger protein